MFNERMNGFGIRRRLLVNLNQNSSCRSADSCAYFPSRVCWVCILFNVSRIKRFQCFFSFHFYINSLAHIFLSLFASPNIFNRLDMNEWMNEWMNGRTDFESVGNYRLRKWRMFLLHSVDLECFTNRPVPQTDLFTNHPALPFSSLFLRLL